MSYLLDTNMCIYLKRHQPPEVVARFDALEPGEVAISSVTLAELEYGVSKSFRQAHDRAVLDELLQLLVILPFDAPAARHFGDVRASLERQGTPIGPFDLQIAAHARSLGLTLVTHNVREFERVSELSLEDWYSEG